MKNVKIRAHKRDFNEFRAEYNIREKVAYEPLSRTVSLFLRGCTRID